MLQTEKTKTSLTSYVGLGDDTDKLLVQKSKPLLDIVRLGLELEELKLFDTFLARINSHKPEICTVAFAKGELEKLFGVERIRQQKLEKYLENLMKPVKVKEDNKTVLISLFSTAKLEKDDDGIWTVVMTCSPTARKHIFNLDNVGYLPYRLKRVTVMDSKYSYILYLYLKDMARLIRVWTPKDNIQVKSWTISLAELKAKLGCSADRYNQFKFFKSEVLNRCKEEIEKKTLLKFDFDLVKEKRVVQAITFFVTDDAEITVKEDEAKQLPDNIQDEKKNATEPDILEELTENDEYTEFMSAVNNELDKKTVGLIVEKIKNKGIPEKDLYYFLKNMWINLTYAEMRLQDKGKPKINDKAKYLFVMLDNYVLPEKPMEDEAHEEDPPHFDWGLWYEKADKALDILDAELTEQLNNAGEKI